MKTLQQCRVTAIIPAAGLGKRFCPGKNKPFQTLGGKPLIIWPLKALQAIPEITEIIPVLRSRDIDIGFEMAKEYNLNKIINIAPGGQERQDSIYNALKLIESNDREGKPRGDEITRMPASSPRYPTCENAEGT